jgi:hypothetical protein
MRSRRKYPPFFASASRPGQFTLGERAPNFLKSLHVIPYIKPSIDVLISDLRENRTQAIMVLFIPAMVSDIRPHRNIIFGQ